MTDRRSTPTLTTISKFNSEKKTHTQTRCGVLPVTYINDKMLVCLGVSGATDQYTVIGGKRKSETPLECALRELSEESRKVFGVIKAKDIEKSLCCFNESDMIAFLEFMYFRIRRHFHQLVIAMFSGMAIIIIMRLILQCLI